MQKSGLAEHIGDRANGLLAASDEDFIAGVARLIDDREFLDELTRRNRERPPDLNWPSCIRRHEAAYGEAVTLMAGAAQR
jgi:glycosyltransferase involved in cell wall biosynthesis